jgi:transposase
VLSLPSSMRIFVCLEPADMRRSFDGLARMAQDIVGRDPSSGHLFVFRNRRGDRVKILWWDRDGYALWYKRLEAGVFRFPWLQGEATEVSPAELAMVLEGIQAQGMSRSKRYQKNLGLAQ